MSGRAAILAVDGGGSKIDAVLLRKDGTVLGAARTLTRQFDHDGDDIQMAQIMAAVAFSCSDAGIDPDRSRSPISVRIASPGRTCPATTDASPGGSGAAALRRTTSCAMTRSRSCAPGRTRPGVSRWCAASAPTAQEWPPTAGCTGFPRSDRSRVTGVARVSWAWPPYGTPSGPAMDAVVERLSSVSCLRISVSAALGT